MPFLWQSGVIFEVDGAKLVLDPRKPIGKATALISHAHEDHARSLGKAAEGNVIATPTTAEFCNHVHKRCFRYTPLSYGEGVRLSELQIAVLNSGHIPGSAMFKITSQNSVTLYTGDINCEDTLVQRGAKPINCDFLIIEATYGNSSYIFPPRDDIYSDIAAWAAKSVKEGRIPVLLAYPIGKAQELTKLFNEFTFLPVVTVGQVTLANEVYSRKDRKIEFFDASSDEGKLFLKTGYCVIIMPAYYRKFRDVIVCEKKISVGVATGWALKYKPDFANVAFPLSNHADFKELIEYVELVSPKKVFVHHGFSKLFVKCLRKRGFDAEALDSK